MKFLLLIYLMLQISTQVFAQANGLLAYFPFNGNADDESGNGYHGTVQGATLVADRFGNPNSAYSFDGVDDHIAFPTLYPTSPNQISIVSWFYVLDLIPDQKIVYHGDNGEFQLFVGNDSAGAAVHLGQTVTDPWYYVRESVTQNEWHMLVAIWIQDESIKLYLNGVLVDSNGVEQGPLLDVGPTYQPSIGSYNRTVGGYFNGMVDDIRIYDRDLTASEIDSLYNEGTSSVEQINETIPEKFTLEQNYPNPFNPTTNIAFSLPERSFVNLAIYNFLGEKVTDLISEELDAGNYRYQWNGKDTPGGIFSKGGYASGVYFYRLKTASYVETKKMILMK